MSPLKDASRPTILVVAKAPVPGFAKTRVARTVGDAAAADLAAASLLDTLHAVATLGWPSVVAMTGDLDRAAQSAALADALSAFDVIEQRGDTLGERLAAAHIDADRGHGVIQIGMDTPQVTRADLVVAAERLMRSRGVIGPADDGGWWLLGLRNGTDAKVLDDVAMSQDDTCDQTIAALRSVGVDLSRIRELNDVDTWADAIAVASEHPDLLMAAVVDRHERGAS
ncbi:MAG: glycosyltransferase [Nocardioidaceae bacterium]|nr:glycosyltransferase [Nocardioidaceae bacterium]